MRLRNAIAALVGLSLLLLLWQHVCVVEEHHESRPPGLGSTSPLQECSISPSIASNMSAILLHAPQLPKRILRSLVANASGAAAVPTCPEWEGKVSAIEEALRDRNAETALVLSQSAADYLVGCRATDNMNGRHLEQLVWKTSNLGLLPGPPTPIRGRVRRVLHVVTMFYPIGGHGRLFKSFIDADPVASRSHSLFFTIPLAKVPAASRPQKKLAQIYGCDFWMSRLRCAQRLRNITATFDAVLLHIHMHDAVACAAFSAGYTGPPVGFVDHADHRFWLGVSSLDVHVALRRVGSTLATQQRGVDAQRSIVIPLPAQTPLMDRAQARAALGMRDSDVLLTMVASRFKFSAALLELIAPLMREHPDVHLHAMGPPRSWAALAAKRGVLPDRIRILDPSPNVTALHAGADIHIDSFPLMSPTSALESALGGAVVLGLCPWGRVGAPFCLDVADYVGDGRLPFSPLLECPSEQAFQAALRELLRDRGLLRQAQHDSRRFFAGTSALAAWGRNLEAKLYGKLLSIPRRDRDVF